MHQYLKLFAAGLISVATLSLHGVQLNEIRTDQPDNPDDEEFVELRGDPGESLDGVWFLYIGDHSGEGSFKGSGTVEIALDLSGYTIPDDGHFLMAGPLFDGEAFGLGVDDLDYFFEGFGNALENRDNVTAMLVRNWTGNGGNEVRGIPDQLGDTGVDIDDNDDGIPNQVLPWDQVIDAIGLVQNAPPDFFYGVAFGYVDLGPDGGFVPSHAYRTSDTNEWLIGQFVLFEEDGNGQIIGLNPDATDTPGSINPISPPEPTIESLSTIFAPPESIITVTGAKLTNVTNVTVGGADANFLVDGETLLVTMPSGISGGVLEVTNPDGSASTANYIVAADVNGAAIAEDFSGGLGDFNTYSVASTANWEASEYRDSFSIEVNGFGADVASDDWLISPAIDLSSVSNPYLRVGHERVYNGPALEAKISTDYSGTGDPAAATWTNLEITLAGDNADEIVDSGETDLSAYAGQTVYVAFRYTSAGTGPGEGAIDRIHYFIVGGETLGWTETAELGWVYYYDAEWGLSLDLGTIYLASFPWIYQTNFGYMYHVAYMNGFGFWLYSPSLEWIFAAQGVNGWFQASGNNWEYDNFITPQQ